MLTYAELIKKLAPVWKFCRCYTNYPHDEIKHWSKYNNLYEVGDYINMASIQIFLKPCTEHERLQIYIILSTNLKDIKCWDFRK